MTDLAIEDKRALQIIKLATEQAEEIRALRLAATPPSPQDREEGTKLVYVKRWRTIVKLPEAYADEIVEALRALSPHTGEAAVSAEHQPKELASSEPLGPLYDGTTMDNQQLDGTTRRNQPVVTAGETATFIPESDGAKS